MKNEDIPALMRLVSDVHKYYRQDVTPFLFGVWERACRQFSLEQVQRALERHTMDPDNGKFCPRASDIVRVLGGTRAERTADAWSRVHDAMARVGAYSDVVFWDPVVHVVIVDMGGWPKLCRTEDKDLSYAQHRFMQLYGALAERGVGDGYQRVLMGDRSPDAEYKKKGLAAPAPALIGDPRDCLLVLSGGGESRAGILKLPAGTSALEDVQHYVDRLVANMAVPQHMLKGPDHE